MWYFVSRIYREWVFLFHFQIVNVNPIDVERKICGAEVDVPPGSMMILDSKTLRNLDLIGGKAGQSMFAVLDKTQTPMGKNFPQFTIVC